VRYLFIALGERDESNPNILANVRRLKDSLDRLGVSSTFALTSGGHSWFNWRRYLARMVNPL
jgi:enterochelin esterase-like enzyme